MKKIIIYCCIWTGILITSCSTKELMFDGDSQYIWFSLPFKTNQHGGLTTERQDSLYYSFALDGPEIDHYIFKLPVSVAGFARDKDRPFKVELVQGKSDVTDNDWDKSVLTNPMIRKGVVFDTLCIRVNRNKVLQSSYRHIALRLLPNEEFQLSDSAYTETVLSFTDILTPPDWWSAWKEIFGTFCPETYLKWREIYHKGADPTANLYDDSQTYYYHCDNMPVSPNLGWYPVLKMYLGLLQTYFKENITYPYGDTTKPQIQIKF